MIKFMAENINDTDQIALAKDEILQLIDKWKTNTYVGINTVDPNILKELWWKYSSTQNMQHILEICHCIREPESCYCHVRGGGRMRGLEITG